jgi:outer membrane immunogenic protein
MDSRVDALGSLRGKVGWVVTPDWLVYGTGGVAFANVKETIKSVRVGHVL